MSHSQMMKVEKRLKEDVFPSGIDEKRKKAVLTSGETASKRSFHAHETQTVSRISIISSP